MGFRSFFNWLLGKSSSEDIEQFQATSSTSIESASVTSPSPITRGRKKYHPVQRTKETKDFVQSLVKKSQSPDPVPRPHQDTVDTKSVEKFVGKIQGKL